jgi:phage gp36-like protein
MSSYASVRDVIVTVSKEIAIQLTDDDKSGEVQEDVIDGALDRAQGLVDAALLEAGYAVPVVTPIPDGAGVVKGATIWLAICDMASRRGILPEDYKTQCTLYEGILQKIASAQLALPLPTSSLSMPHSSTDGQQRRLSLTKWDEKYTGVRNPDEDHSLDIV